MSRTRREDVGAGRRSAQGELVALGVPLAGLLEIRARCEHVAQGRGALLLMIWPDDGDGLGVVQQGWVSLARKALVGGVESTDTSVMAAAALVIAARPHGGGRQGQAPGRRRRPRHGRAWRLETPGRLIVRIWNTPLAAPRRGEVELRVLLITLLQGCMRIILKSRRRLIMATADELRRCGGAAPDRAVTPSNAGPGRSGRRGPPDKGRVAPRGLAHQARQRAGPPPPGALGRPCETSPVASLTLTWTGSSRPAASSASLRLAAGVGRVGGQRRAGLASRALAAASSGRGCWRPAAAGGRARAARGLLLDATGRGPSAGRDVDPGQRHTSSGTRTRIEHVGRLFSVEGERSHAGP